jgi:glycolate oxidase
LAYETAQSSARGPLSADLARSLRAALEDSEVRTLREDLICYSTDASLESQVRPHLPEAVVIPHVRSDVDKIVKFAARHCIPLIPRGAGSGMAAGATPVDGGIVIDMSRLNRIIEVDTPNMQVICEPGVVHATLNEHLKQYKLFFPPDPGSTKMCTVGGMAANDSAGMRAIKYGSTGSYVLGLDVVLASGETITTGTPGSRAGQSVSGLPLTKLFVGSEGILGIITLLRLRVLPVPRSKGLVLGVFDTLNSAGEAVVDTLHSGVLPSALEIMDSSAIDVANKYKPGLNLPSAAAIILIELDGAPAGVEEEARLVSGVIAGKAAQVEWSTDPKRVGTLWQARSVMGSASGLAKPGGTRVAAGEDICVPIAKVPEALQAIRDISQSRDTAIVTYGHIGGGNLHAALVIDTSHDEEIRRAEQAADDIHLLALRLGGTVTGEHGVGLARRQYMRQEHGPALDVMKCIKQALDPQGIMNPGKVLPEE